MSTKAIVAGLIGGVTAFILGFLIFGILLKDFFASNMATGVVRSDEDMIFWAMILGHLALGFLFAYIFDKWANISTFMGGLKAAAAISLFMGATFIFIDYGSMNIYNLTYVLVHLVLLIVIGGIVGGVVGLVLGRGK